RRRHTRFSRDWSSDVCSSDLHAHALRPRREHAARSRTHRRQQPATAGMTAIEDRMVPRALAMIARHGVSATYANYISSEMTVEGDIEVDEDGDGLNEETDYTVTVSLPVPVDEVGGDAQTIGESVTFLAGSGLT